MLANKTGHAEYRGTKRHQVWALNATDVPLARAVETLLRRPHELGFVVEVANRHLLILILRVEVLKHLAEGFFLITGGYIPTGGTKCFYKLKLLLLQSEILYKLNL